MTVDEALEVLKEHLCPMCANGAKSMDECDIRDCNIRNAFKILERYIDTW